MPTSTNDRAAQPRQGLALWVGFLGPSVIWLIQFQVKYSIAARTTFTSRTVVMVASLVALLAVTACGVVASRQHRLANASPLDEFARTGPRIRFMATLGMLTSGLFFLLILAQLAADLWIEAGVQ
jgi:hypothetical protein